MTGKWTWSVGLVAAALALAGARPATACLVPPEHLRVHHAKLVRSAQRIALARFERFERISSFGSSGGTTGYRALFTTVEALRGGVASRFSLDYTTDADVAALNRFKDPADADFHGHRDWDVWDDLFTRQGNSGDCRMYPSFERGATYLVFLDDEHWRGFERIDRPDDQWLRAVKALIANPSLRSGLSLSLADYLAEHKTVFVGEIARCHTGERYAHEVKVRSLLKGTAPDSVFIRKSRGEASQCRPGLLVVGVIRPFGRSAGTGDSRPAGRLFQLVDEKGTTSTLSDGLFVDFNRGGSEAIITKPSWLTLGELRTLLAPRAPR